MLLSLTQLVLFSLTLTNIFLQSLFTPLRFISEILLCVSSVPICPRALSVCISLPEVPDLAGGGGLDLPHSVGAAHGAGQLGHGLRHRLLPRR